MLPGGSAGFLVALTVKLRTTAAILVPGSLRRQDGWRKCGGGIGQMPFDVEKRGWSILRRHPEIPPRFRDQRRERACGAKTVQRKRVCDKKNVPAKHPAPEAEARIPCSDEDEGRSSHPQGAAGQRPSQAVGVTSELVAQRKSLKSRREFRRVMEMGRAARRDGITVFVGDYDPAREPRLGLAVRRRRSAVRRNRARRRLRAAAAQSDLPHRDVVIRADDVVAEVEFQKLVDALKSAVRAQE